jgi:hypothetical protein
MDSAPKPSPRRAKIVKLRAVVAWVFVLVALVVAVLAVWRLPIVTPSGHESVLLDAALGVAIFLLTLYAVALFFGSLGLYIAAGMAVLGLLGLLAGYGDHNAQIVTFSSWCVGIAVGVAVITVAVRLLFGRKSNEK